MPLLGRTEDARCAFELSFLKYSFTPGTGVMVGGSDLLAVHFSVFSVIALSSKPQENVVL